MFVLVDCSRGQISQREQATYWWCSRNSSRRLVSDLFVVFCVAHMHEGTLFYLALIFSFHFFFWPGQTKVYARFLSVFHNFISANVATRPATAGSMCGESLGKAYVRYACCFTNSCWQPCVFRPSSSWLTIQDVAVSWLKYEDTPLSSTCNIQGQGSEMPSSFCSSTVSLSAEHIPWSATLIEIKFLYCW